MNDLGIIRYKNIMQSLLYWSMIFVWPFWIEFLIAVHEESQLLLTFDSKAETLFLNILFKNALGIFYCTGR